MILLFYREYFKELCKLLTRTSLVGWVFFFNLQVHVPLDAVIFLKYKIRHVPCLYGDKLAYCQVVMVMINV